MRRIHNDNPNPETSQTQNDRIRKYLEEGHTVTILESLYLFECLNLRGRMSDLKKLDVPWDGVFIKVGKWKKHVKAYYIPDAFAKRNGLEVDSELPEKVAPIAIVAAKKTLRRFARRLGRI